MRANQFLLLLFFIVCASNASFAQDIVTKKNGEDVKLKVLEISQTEIKYKRYESLEGPIYTMSKADVLKITFEDGTVEVYDVEDVVSLGASKDGLYVQG
ncbi:hypothetical protein [Pontibacter harenae]|uniref:hypothetical protein n=1 Tax=Pontibacter harenae TaxID=2894083 RepID=UPI001E56CC8B|nr:hypothetical protein [Pontibacter harenae]MCC9165589.1 hypothetical protein [Pontibacter harenae]